MTSPERPRRGDRVSVRAALAMAVALLAPAFWVTVVLCPPAQGAVLATATIHTARVEASAPAHDSGHVREHKEGPVAVVASVIGIIVVVVCIAGLGSLSVRRRTRDRPPAGGPTQGGPPGRERGLINEWFRPRR